MTALRDGLRIVVTLGVGLLAAISGVFAFITLPQMGVSRLGVVLAVLVAFVGLFAGRSLADSLFSRANVAEVAIEGPITRSGGRVVPRGPIGTPADRLVEQIERADAADNIQALIVRLNTPGGEIVPSDDLRQAVAAFDGPTIAYATDQCASGGYWIAAGCEELWARDVSLVGSIGVLGSRVNAAGLADRLGISYERLVAGEYKDAGTPLRELDDEDRAYLQERVDQFYEQFVERVAEGRDLDPETVRETEARVYTGEEAAERGLVDTLGTREDIEATLEDRLDVSTVIVEEFTPAQGVTGRLRRGASTVAYAFGAGIGARLTDADISQRFRFR